MLSKKREVERKNSVDSTRIAEYYDANTAKFLRFGGAGDTAAIHRAIWAPGVSTANEAFLFLNRFVAEAVTALIHEEPGKSHLIDFGCGVGGTATFLAKRLGVRVTGITISAEQCRVAQNRAQREGVGAITRFVQADFDALPKLAIADAAYAIESFAHAPDASAFFAMAAKSLRQGARLIICDDFLLHNESREARYWVNRFTHGWHLNNVITVEETCRLAEEHGLRLIKKHALTAHLRPFKAPLLWALLHLTKLPLPWAYWHNLAGGTALQYCLQQGWTEYHALVWEKI